MSLTRESIVVTDFDGNPAPVTEFTVTWDASAAEKGGYDTFMLKEIAEQPRAVADTLRGRIGRDGLLHLDEMRLSDTELREIDKIIVIACGTAYHAGLIAKYAIEHWTRIPCEVELASAEHPDGVVGSVCRKPAEAFTAATSTGMTNGKSRMGSSTSRVRVWTDMAASSVPTAT